MNTIPFVGNLVFNQSAKGHNYATVLDGRLMGYTLSPEQTNALKALRQETGVNKAGRKMSKFGLVKMSLVVVDQMEDIDDQGRTSITPIYAMDGLPTRADDPSNVLFD